MRQSRGRGSKVETEARPCEAEARPSQLKKTASRPPQAETDASRTTSLTISNFFAAGGSGFYPRDVVSAVYMLYGNVAGWLGVCLSHASIVSKRLNLSSNFFDHLVAPPF